jgi:hypothetical protein
MMFATAICPHLLLITLAQETQKIENEEND